MRRSLGPFQIRVLTAMLRVGANASVALIWDEVGSDFYGAVYTTLRRLEQKGRVTSSVGRPLPKPGGRRRRCYTITRAAAEELGKQLEYVRYKALRTPLEPLFTKTVRERKVFGKRPPLWPDPWVPPCSYRSWYAT